MKDFDLRKYLAENKLIKEDRRRIVDYDNRDDRTTELFLDNGDSVEVDVIELYDNLKENNPEDLAENKLIKEDISSLRGKELLDLFNFTKYMNVDVKELETEFIEAINGGWFTDPSIFEEEKKDFTYESGDRFLDTNEDKISEYLGFEIDTSRMIEDYTMGEPMGVEFVHSDEDFEGWMDEVGSFWN